MNSVVVMARLDCLMGLMCIKGARGGYAADIFLVAWCVCKLNLEFPDSTLDSE